MSQVPKPHEPGEVLGPYRLERRLGRGGAAEVWLAVEQGDMGFSKRQALKLLRPPRGQLEPQKKALINEARVCGRLGHPGIVDVYRVGEVDGELYIAMEMVDGPDLNSLLAALRSDGVSIPVGACVDLCIELCEALDHAHNACDDDGTPLYIIHRDLKPSNVLVDRRGLVKISDWGLVKSTLNIESTTRGIVKGTPGYIAPEVWGGSRNFQPSVDLFAVGVMLYELVVGARLFRGANLAQIAEQVARRKPSEEAARVAERVPALVPVLEKALQRSPAHRYQTAMELADDLRSVRDELPTRDDFRSFLRGVKPVIERLVPVAQRSSETSRPMHPSGLEESAPESFPVGATTASIAAVIGPGPTPPSKEAMSSQGSAAPPGRRVVPDSPVPPTRAMAPNASITAAADTDGAEDTNSRKPMAGAAETVAFPRHELPVGDTAKGPEVPAPRPRGKGRTARGDGRRDKRRPPPTAAVVAVVVGLLVLLVGVLVLALR